MVDPIVRAKCVVGTFIERVIEIIGLQGTENQLRHQIGNPYCCNDRANQKPKVEIDKLSDENKGKRVGDATISECCRAFLV